MSHTIHVQQLSKTYKAPEREGGFGAAAKSFFNRKYKEVKAVQQVDFKIEQGEIVGFLGPNGAGKTTTLKMLSGLLHPTGGKADVLVFRLVNTMMIALIWPNTEKFNQSIRDGSMDYTILQPVNSMFLVTFSRITVWRIWDLVLAVILIVTGVNMAGETTTAPHILTFILLALSGMIVIYSLWIVLIALTFWFVKFDNNVTILQALLDAGRYPATVYPVWLRVIVTFIIPIAVATTVPLQALRGELDTMQALTFLAVSVLSFVIASRVWKSGLKQYSGASS